MDSAARTTFLALLGASLDDAGRGVPEWCLYGPPEWMRTILDYRGWAWKLCRECGDYRYIVTDHDHHDGEGNFLGTEPQQWPCPACVTGEHAAAGVFPSGLRR